MPGSTKFSIQTDSTSPLGTGYCPGLIRKEGALPSELSAFDLSRVCHTLHNIIEGDKLFYANNEFEFSNTQTLLDYLVALSSDRRNAIKSIKVKFDCHGVPEAAFIMLAVCYGLKSLTLDIGGMANFFNPGFTDFTQAPGYGHLISLRGLKSVTLIYGNKVWHLIDDILARIPRAWISPEKAESEKAILQSLQQLERNISVVTSQPRPRSSTISTGELRFAINQAGLNFWGDTINGALTPPGQANLGFSNTMNNNMANGVNDPAILAGQQPLSEQEQWAEIDRTNLASWDLWSVYQSPLLAMILCCQESFCCRCLANVQKLRQKYLVVLTAGHQRTFLCTLLGKLSLRIHQIPSHS